MQEEKRRLITAAIIFAAVVAVLWAVKAFEMISGISLAQFGILPLQAKGLPGILFAPLLHANLAHLTANSAPLFFLGALLIYYYPKNALSIFSLSWLLTGLWVWLFARGQAYHIGASGVVYALAVFHFASGVIRREPRLMALSMLVIFLYGSMVWGFFPDFFPKENISWESHLMGALAGLVLAVYYRDEGPQAKEYQWDDDDETDLPYNDEKYMNAPGSDKKTEADSSNYHSTTT